MSDYFIHGSSYVDQPCEIGAGTSVWHFCHIMPHCKIGQHCNIGQNVFIGQNVVLGNNVKVQNNVSVYDGVICEDDVFLGPSMVFTNVSNPRSAVPRKDEFKKTILRQGVTIGANATIVCGHEIGRYALVGAGSVVAKDVKPYALMVGNPATQVGWVSANGQKLDFGEMNTAVCPATGEKYLLEKGQVHQLED